VTIQTVATVPTDAGICAPLQTVPIEPAPATAPDRVPAIKDGDGQLDFRLPSELEAGEPAEARGLARDEVRLMVSSTADDSIHHTQFRRLPDILREGDLLVVNTSGTLNAAIRAWDENGLPLELHLSTQLPAGIWNVELREPTAEGTTPYGEAFAGMRLRLDGGGSVAILAPYSCGCDGRAVSDVTRLWLATFDVPGHVTAYFGRHGFPIRYSYVRKEWPGEYYQTVYATEPGSAEMPSAGRAFTADLITSLVSRGVEIAPLILHTGVASLESVEPPYEEFYRVPATTARRINAARASGARVIAVGTTVVRALETVTSGSETHPGEGWTCHVVGPDRPIRSVNGLLTGLHEPRSSHLMLLEGLARRAHLHATYQAALDLKYLWHEFGDLHLILE
jgi:S-adenosylmethionine:tRNA ribosyltransferase-isomerase